MSQDHTTDRGPHVDMTERAGQVTVTQDTLLEEGAEGGAQEGEGTRQAADRDTPTDPHTIGHGTGRRHGVVQAMRDSIHGCGPARGPPRARPTIPHRTELGRAQVSIAQDQPVRLRDIPRASDLHSCEHLGYGAQPRGAVDTRTEEEAGKDSEDDATAEWCEVDYEDRPRPKRDTHIRAILQQVYRLVGYDNLSHRQKAMIGLLVRDSIKLGTIAWGTAQAKAWGKNWKFGHVRLIADAAYIAHHGGMTGASRARWDELSGNRLTKERVHEQLDETNPYFEQVEELSKRGGGIPVWVPEDFVPNGRSEASLTKLSAQTREVGGALRRMVSDGFHQKQLCFVLTLADALKYDPHISPSQWAAKAGKPQGRNCNNCMTSVEYIEQL